MRTALLSSALFGTALVLSCLATDFATPPRLSPAPPKDWTATDCPPELLRTLVPEGAEVLKAGPLVVRGDRATLCVKYRLARTTYRKAYYFKAGQLWFSGDCDP
jgi:hypothetical protein